MGPYKRLVKAGYVNESACKTIAKFRLGAAGLGNKAPRAGRPNRTKLCPLCATPTPSDEQHPVMVCGAFGEERKLTGLQTVINLGRLGGKEARKHGIGDEL